MILKINANRRNLKKKLKLSRTSLGVLSIISAVTVLLTACGKTKDKTYNYNNITSNYSYSTYNSNDSLDNPLTTKDYFDYSNKYVDVSDASYNEFINYLDGIQTIYSYEEFYNIDAAIKKYNEVKNIKVQKHSHTLSSISVDALISSVKNNNKKYLEQKKKEYTAAFYEEFNENELRNICTIIVDEINYFKDNVGLYDIEETKCVLGSLKILKKTTMTNAYITDDNCLMISPSMIDTLKIKTISSNQDVFKDTVCHEAIHLMQKGCTDTNEIRYCIGNSYKSENLSINPLYFQWFLEGSAEKLSNNYTKDNPLVYNYYISYINSLSLSTILKSNNYVNQIEETTLNRTLSSLFDAFDCKTEKDKKEIIKMMYSLDIIERGINVEDFINSLNAKITDDYSEEMVRIKRNLKTSVCETLTKSFYKNLATIVKDNNVPLQDIFFLITVFEADLDTHLTYTDESKYEDNIGFIEKYVKIQNNFFAYLSSSKNISQDDIETIYNDYGIYRNSGEKNYTLSYLNSEKKDFIEFMINELKNNKTEQIRDTYTKYSKLEY